MRGIRTFILRTSIGLLLPLAAPLQAGAQGAPWVWLDANGRRVFSDRPPPPEVPDRRILRQPASAWPDALPRVDSIPAPAANGTPATPAAAPLAPNAGGAPQAQRPASAGNLASAGQAASRQQAEAAERERIAALRADNCSRARSALATIESGIRLTTTNARGEREILDEAGRSAEAARLRGIMASDCAAP